MKRTCQAAAFVAAAFFFLFGAAPAGRPPDDIVLAGGLVADGTGAPLFAADVAVRGDLIAAIR